MNEMDEKITTERILHRMTDPKLVEQRRLKKKEVERVEVIKNKHSL